MDCGIEFGHQGTIQIQIVISIACYDTQNTKHAFPLLLITLSDYFHRDSQEGTLEVDGGRPIKSTSPGELRKLNADTVLYVGKLSPI